MEIAQLRALREVQARGSIAAAAQALHVTASSVSQQLSALQRKAGTALTYKQGRRTALTPAGLALCRAAADVEVALARADSAVQRFADDAGAPVSVAAFHSAGLALFRRLEQAVEESGGPTLVFSDEDVAQGGFAALAADYDVVVAHRLSNSPAWPETVHATPLAFEPLDIAVGTGHRLARRKSVLPADLRGERWVSVHRGFPLDDGIERIAALAGEEAVIAHRINEFFVAASLVEGGGCIALMPRYTLDRRYFPQLKLLPLRTPEMGRHIDILARPESMERAGVQQVVRTLHSVMGELVNHGGAFTPIL